MDAVCTDITMSSKVKNKTVIANTIIYIMGRIKITFQWLIESTVFKE